MEVIGKILEILQTSMDVPTAYGWFHLMFVILTVIATVLLCVFFRDCDKKTFKRIVMISWIIMIFFEVYKQVSNSFFYSDGKIVFDYPWIYFPFQLCSTPFYVLPFIFLLKDGKVKDIFMSFLMSFSLFGGLAVMLYPGDVFNNMVGINIQTMFHHGIQTMMGIYCMVYNRKRLNFKFWLQGVYLFIPLVFIALGLNISIYNILDSMGIHETCNMFFIGPYYPCTLPVLSMIYPMVPYIVFLLIYILGFTLVSYIVYLAQLGIYKLVLKKYEN